MDFALIGSPADMVVVMVVALVVFGPKRLPEVGRQIGGFVRDFRKTISSFTDAVEDTRSEFHSVINPVPGPYPPRLESTIPEQPTTAVAQPLMHPYDQLEPDANGPREVVVGPHSPETQPENEAPVVLSGVIDKRETEEPRQAPGASTGSLR